MAQDVSSSPSGGFSAFDFNSQAGVLAVLGAIRASGLSVADRNELRDLVFLYANGGGDPAVRNMLEDRLRTKGITPDQLKTAGNGNKPGGVKPAGYTAGFSGGRPSPVFENPTFTPVVAPSSTPAQTPVSHPISQSPAPVNPTSIPVPTQAPITPRIEPDISLSRPVSNNVVPETPVTKAPEMPMSTPPAPNMAPTPTPNPAPAPSATPTSAPVGVPADRQQNLDRIRAIKFDVNKKIGNPVNLVDIDNVLGREYMNALLEAMKQLNGPNIAEADAAMQRLETVYARVQTVLANTPTANISNDLSNQAGVNQPVVTKPAPGGPPFENVASIPPPTPKINPVVPESRPVTPPAAPVPKPTASVVEPLQKTESVSVPVSSAPTRPVEDVVPSANQVPEIVTPPTNPMPVTAIAPNTPQMAGRGEQRLPVNNIESNYGDNSRVNEDSAPQEVSIGGSGFASVAESRPPLKTIDDLPTADSINTSASGADPLYTQEVDQGLNQLLSEWPLFKKSGLFGTGPKGKEHPLFKKLAPLQIPMLLAGRFEGSTQEIKQSVTDYMNGWRYEQGIIYEKGESFEKYLRRVIYHIISLQKKRRGS